MKLTLIKKMTELTSNTQGGAFILPQDSKCDKPHKRRKINHRELTDMKKKRRQLASILTNLTVPHTTREDSKLVRADGGGQKWKRVES